MNIPILHTTENSKYSIEIMALQQLNEKGKVPPLVAYQIVKFISIGSEFSIFIHM